MGTLYVQPMGGFGNVLFCYLAGLGIARKHGMKLLLAEKYEDKRGIMSKYSLFSNLPFGDPPENMVWYREPQYKYSEVKIPDPSKNYGLWGYFQSWKYSTDVIAEAKQKMWAADPEKVKNAEALYVELKKGMSTVAVHIRRGDFKNFPEIHPIVPGSYYFSALEEQFKDCHPIFFSDDPSYTRATYGHLGPVVDAEDQLSFLIMTMCDNFLIANSSFSLLAYYFRQERRGRLVHPDVWFGPKGPVYSFEDLIPPCTAPAVMPPPSASATMPAVALPPSASATMPAVALPPSSLAIVPAPTAPEGIIYVQTCCGFGNILFCYLAGLAVARKCDGKLVLVDWNGIHRPVASSYKLLSNLSFAKSMPPGIRQYYDPRYRFTSIPIPNKGEKLAMGGYYQSWKYSVDVLEEAKKKMLRAAPDLVTWATDFLKRLPQKLTVMVHIRRGDFGDGSGVWLVLPDSYYFSSLKHFPDCHPLFFSDEPKYARATYGHLGTVVDEDTEKSFILMTMCDNFIIANSSYSLMAYYFRDKRNARLVRPDAWFGPKGQNYHFDDLIPPVSSEQIVESAKPAPDIRIFPTSGEPQSDSLYGKMLIPFATLVGKYTFGGRILHIGAHYCEERADYGKHGFSDSRVTWVEGDPETARHARQLYPQATILDAVVSDISDQVLDFVITNNGQSSSILELDEHKKEHPDVKEVGRRKVTTITVDELLQKNGIPVHEIEFVNIDIQGAELLALKGALKVLYYAQYLYLEVNQKPLYKGCALLPELDAFLLAHGFQRVEISMTAHGWGDALYEKIDGIKYVNNCNPATNGEVLLWKRLQKECKVIFDVGARTDLDYCTPDSTAYLFEPNYDFYMKLFPYGCDRIRPLNFGLGDKEEEKRYFNRSQSFHKRDIMGDNMADSQILRLRRLDTVARENGLAEVDFCKIDTEGNEYYVLLGAGEFLKKIRYVQFEYGGTYPDCGRTLREVYRLLQDNGGFQYIYMITTHGLLAQPEVDEHYQYSNYLASRVPL